MASATIHEGPEFMQHRRGSNPMGIFGGQTMNIPQAIEKLHRQIAHLRGMTSIDVVTLRKRDERVLSLRLQLAVLARADIGVGSHLRQQSISQSERGVLEG